MRHTIPPRQAWHGLACMRQMVAHEPALDWAVSWLPLYDQLDLTLELLQTDGNSYLDEDPSDPTPSNVIRLRLRRAR